MKLAPASTASLHAALTRIAELYSGEEDQLVSTDFYLMPSNEGSLCVYNDDDESIATAEVPEWETYEPDTFYAHVEADLREAIAGANANGELERLAVWMPYSFVLVDEERETIADLLLVDEDTLLVTDSLLEGLNEELNSFLEQLLDD